MKKYRAIGLMSGTSLDGVDAALIQTDGQGFVQQEGFLTFSYDESFRDKIRACFGLKPQELSLAEEASRELTLAHVSAVKKLLEQKNLQSKDIDMIGFHGHTISHAPHDGYTCQIGDGKLLSEMTGIPVVYDIRMADVKAGGHGAPLGPIYHQALAHNQKKPVVFLNIGGVANITYVGDKDSILAFDTGPGNALLDDWILKHTGNPYDKGGAVAKSGKVDAAVLQQLLAHPYFSVKPPKSLDRNAFVSDVWKGLSLEDGAATLAAFTVRSIAKSAEHFPAPANRWIVCGGGRLNAHLMESLQGVLGVPVVPVEAIGFNGDAIEAEAWAYLAVRNMLGLHISYPTTTGITQTVGRARTHGC